MSETKLNLKEFAGELVNNSGYSIPTIANILGITKKTFYNWINGVSTRVDRNLFEQYRGTIKERLKTNIVRVTDTEIYVTKDLMPDNESAGHDSYNSEINLIKDEIKSLKAELYDLRKELDRKNEELKQKDDSIEALFVELGKVIPVTSQLEALRNILHRK